MAFYGSSQVQVFPSAYRGQYTSGKYTSERNFINIIKTMGDIDSFVVDFSAGDTGVGTLSVVVKGYYFEINSFDTSDANNTYLDVKIDHDYLVNYNDSTTVLDNSSGFVALYHGQTDSSGSSLQVIKNGQIINRGYLKALRDEDGNWLKLSGLKITDDGKLDARTIDFNTLTDYVYVAKLIAGGATKLTNSSGTAINKGSNIKPVYFSAGVPAECAYSLSATVNLGSGKGRLAYYNETNNIVGYSSDLGNSTKPIYLKAGVPTAFNSTVGAGGSNTGFKPVYLNAGTITVGPQITYSTSTPSGGSDGDIWFVYTN